MRCDRCTVPDPHADLQEVTCVYGCKHWQCAECATWTTAEARNPFGYGIRDANPRPSIVEEVPGG